jgi:hypothetical protein
MLSSSIGFMAWYIVEKLTLHKYGNVCLN